MMKTKAHYLNPFDTIRAAFLSHENDRF